MPAWDMTKEYCPYGHLISECMRELFNKKTGTIHHYCRIHKNDLKRAADKRLRDSRKHRSDRLVEYLQGEKSMRMSGRPPANTPKQIMKRMGKLQSPGRSWNEDTNEMMANVQLVCSHLLTFPRSALWAPNRMSYPLWCHVCEKMKNVHQMSSSIQGQLAMVYYPLEDCSDVKVWKHEKNAGSGRA